MTLVEIITNPPHEEFIDKYDHVFTTATPVGTIRDMTLYTAVYDDFKFLGLFNKRHQLVGVLKLMQYKNTDMWQVVNVQLAPTQRGQGYGTFMYDFAVMNMKLKLLSDTHQSEGGPGGSVGLWKRLYMHGRYKVVGYNTYTDQIVPQATPLDVYNQNDDLIWLALPPGGTINEVLAEQNKGRTDRTIVWYGPTIIDRGEF